MCGLVGILSSSPFIGDSDLSLFANLLLVDQIRGAHATGVAKVSTKENTVQIRKEAKDALMFLANPEAGDFLAKDRANLYIGHNRYATMGNKGEDKNAHPFQHEHITLVHNGGVEAHALNLLDGSDDDNVEVDSHMVAITLANHGIKELVEKKLQGAYTLIWWDSKERTLNFIRNLKRPLWMATLQTGALVWASEKGMLDVFCDRTSGNQLLKYRIAPQQLAANTHYKFSFNEHGHRVGVPQLTKMEELDYPAPKSYTNWENWENTVADWYGRKGTGKEKEKDAPVDDKRVSNIKDSTVGRTNFLMNKYNYLYEHGSVVSGVVVSRTPYDSKPEWCTLVAKDLKTGLVFNSYGISTKETEGVTHVRGQIANVWEKSTPNTPVELYVEIGSVGMSIHDPKHVGNGTAESFSTMNGGGSDKGSGEPKQVAPKPLLLTRSTYENLKPIRYPLKVQGHTFQAADDFSDFVSISGCAECGAIPSAYDRRNNNIKVYEGSGFGGLLKDCLFSCGSCSEALS